MRTITACHTIDHVNPRDWDRLAGDQVLMGRGWLRTIEQAYLGALSPTYLTLYENDRPVAATALRRIRPNGHARAFDAFLFGGLQPWVSRLEIGRAHV